MGEGEVEMSSSGLWGREAALGGGSAARPESRRHGLQAGGRQGERGSGLNREVGRPQEEENPPAQGDPSAAAAGHPGKTALLPGDINSH